MPAPLRALLTALVLAPATSCSTDLATLSLRCDVVLTDASPSSALPGSEVVLTGHPFTSVWDSAVYVGDLRAQLTDLSREDCDDCDECREEQDCTACSDCDACDAACGADCVETATFTVPDAPAGPALVRLYSSHGASAPITLTVEAPPAETATGETGAGETGASETAPSETGGAETAVSGP